MELSDIARAVEDGVNRRGIVKRRAQGWLPRILPYTGYGSVQAVHILARAIMADPEQRPPAILSALPSSAHASFLLPEDIAEAISPAYDAAYDIALAQAAYLQRGFRSFFTTQVGYLPVTVTIGGHEFRTRTDRSGYIDCVVRGHGLEPGWHNITLTPAKGDPVQAPVMIVGPEVDFGLVSDVDDTIVHTWLPRAALAAWNSFFLQGSARQPVPGMAEFYAHLLEPHPDAPVFYLSTGAWNTVPTMQAFIEANGYPNGPMLFTDWGPTPTGMFRNGQAHKKQQLRNLMITFPNIKWVLVGDDGQHDPFLYEEVAREHPSHVRGLAFRQLGAVEQVLSHAAPIALRDWHGIHPERDVAEEIFSISGRDGVELLQVYQALA